MHIFLAIQNQPVTRISHFEAQNQAFLSFFTAEYAADKNKGAESHFRRFCASFRPQLSSRALFNLRCIHQSILVYFLSSSLWLGLMQQIHQTHMHVHVLPFCLSLHDHDLER